MGEILAACRGLGSFGKIIECRLVIDQRTMKFKGSAFVEFEQETSARRAVEASKQDPGVEVAGLYVQVRIARSKGAMDEDDASKGSEKDRRNLYLAREGKLQPNSAAVEGVSETDMAKRQRFVVQMVNFKIHFIFMRMNALRLAAGSYERSKQSCATQIFSYRGHVCQLRIYQKAMTKRG